MYLLNYIVSLHYYLPLWVLIVLAATGTAVTKPVTAAPATPCSIIATLLSRQRATDLQQRVDRIDHRQDASTHSYIWIAPGDYNFSHDNFNISNARNLRLVVAASSAELSIDPLVARHYHANSSLDHNNVKNVNATFWFSGDAGINISHSTNVRLGGIIHADENGYEYGTSSPSYSMNSSFIIIDYDPLPSSSSHTNFQETSGITLHLFNCSNVTVEDVVLRAAPFMAVTAFQGYGNHTFRNIHFVPHPSRDLVGRRDAMHFSDLRVGPTVINSTIGYTGDDFFNVHSTMLLVLNCSHNATEGRQSSSKWECLLVNPRVLPSAPRNSVYGTFSTLEFVRPGDVLSFYPWPAADMVMQLPLVTNATVVYLENVSADYGALAQEILPPLLQYPPNTSWHQATNQTTQFAADDVWRVSMQLNTTVTPISLPPVGSIVTVDTITTGGTQLINNVFSNTNCNFGRFKSPGSIIRGNTFRGARNENLEITPLPQWFEGPVNVRDIDIEDNVFYVHDSHQLPIYCGPLCEHPGCPYGRCRQCPLCDNHDSAWTKNVRLRHNRIVPLQELAPLQFGTGNQARH
jgi:hypothetical protein